jgi:hypothetical protein
MVLSLPSTSIIKNGSKKTIKKLIKFYMNKLLIKLEKLKKILFLVLLLVLLWFLLPNFLLALLLFSSSFLVTSDETIEFYIKINIKNNKNFRNN